MSRYAVPSDLAALGLPVAATDGTDPAALQAALDAASDRADSYLRSRFTLPLTTVTNDLKSAVCSIAAFRILTTRGFNPESGSDTALKLLFDDAIKWLTMVGDGRITPAFTDSSGDPDAPTAPLVISNCRRGW